MLPQGRATTWRATGTWCAWRLTELRPCVVRQRGSRTLGRALGSRGRRDPLLRLFNIALQGLAKSSAVAACVFDELLDVLVEVSRTGAYVLAHVVSERGKSVLGGVQRLVEARDRGRFAGGRALAGGLAASGRWLLGSGHRELSPLGGTLPRAYRTSKGTRTCPEKAAEPGRGELNRGRRKNATLAVVDGPVNGEEPLGPGGRCDHQQGKYPSGDGSLGPPARSVSLRAGRGSADVSGRHEQNLLRPAWKPQAFESSNDSDGTGCE